MKKEKLFYLDFIRAIAMLIVVGFHFFSHFKTFNIVGFNPLLNTHIKAKWGPIGVNLFFIISGISLMYNYSNEINYKLYFKKRIKAIYPMFWIAYIVFFLVNIVLKNGVDPTIPKTRFILSFLGIDGYFLYLQRNFYILGEWFLGAIIFIYILFPLYRLVMKKDRKIAGIVFIIHFVLSVYILQYNLFKMDANRNLIVCISSFLLGIYFIEYIKEVKWYYALSASIILILSVTINRISELNVMPLIQGGLLVVVLIYISKFVNNKKVQKIFTTLSKYSYSIFLVHHIIIMKIESLFRNKTLGIFEIFVLFLGVFTIIFLISIILFFVTKKITILIENQYKKIKKV